MDMQTEIRESVDARVKKYGIGVLEQQRPIIQEQLMLVEEYFQKLISEQKYVQRKIKELTKLNRQNVSSGANVQRSTIYNNPNTLGLFIDKRIEEIQKEDILGINKSMHFKSKNEDVMNILEGLQQQVVDTFELTLQINKIELDLKIKNEQIESAQKEIFRLEQENIKLQKESNKQQNKVVAFRK